MTGLEALNKFVNIFAEYCVKTQHQEMNATNMQTAVEYLARSEECRTIEKSLKALEVIKRKTVDIWLIQNKKTLKQYNSMVDESRQLTEDEFELLRSVLV